MKNEFQTELKYNENNNNPLHLSLVFNDMNATKINFQKHLAMLLDSRLNLNEYLENIFRKVKSGICIIPKLWHVLPRSALLPTYKPFALPCLAYDDIIYDQAYKESLHLKLESHQYNNTRLAITRAIIDSSIERVYQELETLCKISWLCKISLFYKMN